MRGISAPIGEALMLLAVITASMIIISALIYNVSLMGSEIKKSSVNAAKYIGTSISLVDAYVNTSTNCHYVYLKNVGTTPITDFDKSTIILGNASLTFLLHYAGYNISSPGLGNWSYVDIEHPNQVWEVSETVELILCPPENLTSPYKLVIALPSGNTFTWTYSG